jgi:hypothetical protein
MANKYMKKCSKYVAIKKMLIKKKKNRFSRCRWLKPIILATQEAEIRRDQEDCSLKPG